MIGDGCRYLNRKDDQKSQPPPLQYFFEQYRNENILSIAHFML